MKRINLWKHLKRTTCPPLLLLLLFNLLTNVGLVHSQNSPDLNHLDNISTEIPPTDSAAQSLKSMEAELIGAGDTLLAFTNYIQWTRYLIDRGNYRLWGSDLDPYKTYAEDHPAFREHHLYKFVLGLNHIAEGRPRQAVRHLLDIENNISSEDLLFLEAVYFDLYTGFLALTDYQGAAEYALKLLEQAQQEKNKPGELAARLMVATTFAKQGRFEETSRQRNQAAQLARETGEYGQLIFIYANNAIDERKQKNYDASFQYYNDALVTIDTNSTFHKADLLFYQVFVHANKLTLFNDVGMTDSTILSGPAILDSLESYGATASIIDAHIQIGRAFLLEGKTEQALYYLEKAKNKLEGSGRDQMIIEVNSLLADVYKTTGFYQKAAEALSDQIRVQNQVDSINNAQLINSLQMRYESDRQQAVIEQKELEVQQGIRERKANMRIFLVSIIGLSLIGFSIFQWKHRLQLKREKNLEIKYNQQLIQFQEDENRRISKELHDGIGQSLMLIKNKVQLNHDGITAQMVGDTLEEVRTISRALHPFTLQKLGLTAALQKLIGDFDTNTDIFVDTAIEDIDQHYTNQSALNIFRIAQECLNNILKHSQAKAVEFRVRKHTKHAELYIKDNGRGFDVSENFNTVSSLGLKTLRERTRFLKGQLNIHSEKGAGTKITLKIPYDD